MRRELSLCCSNGIITDKCCSNQSKMIGLPRLLIAYILLHISSAIPSEETFCSSEICKNIGSEILKNLNESADPCENFFEYSCGGWVRKNPVPGFSGEWSRFGELVNKTRNLIREILEERHDDDSESLRKAQEFYTLCMNTSHIESRRVDPLLAIIKKNHNWPILEKSWDGSNVSWIGIHEKYFEEAGHSSIFDIGVKKIESNPKENMLTISLSDPPIVAYALKEKNLLSQRRLAVTGYLHNTTLAFLNATDTEYNWKATIGDIIDITRFENGLVRIALRKHEMGPKEVTIKELQESWDKSISEHSHLAVDWLAVINSRLIELANVMITGNEKVSIYPSTLLDELATTLKKASLKAAVNYIHWTFVKRYMKYTNSMMYNITDNFNKEVYSYTRSQERWTFCVKHNQLKHVVYAEFLKKHTRKNIRSMAKELADNIKLKLKSKIMTFDPVNKTIGQNTTDILDAMGYNVGYPDWYSNALQVDKIDNKFSLKSEYFESMIAYNKFQMERILRQLKYPDKEDLPEWSTESILEPNAYYDITRNLMTLPVGILRFPFFDPDLPQVFIYSQLGTILGHEMSHAFTSRNEREPFYQSGSECFREQYKKYEVVKNANNESVYINVDETLDENVVDNMGLSLSFEVYKSKKIDGTIKDTKIPELSNFSDEKLFFLGFANSFCGQETDAYLLNPLASMVHSPFRWRIEGAVSNTEGFAEAFGCKPKSRMNPLEKCSIWIIK